MGSALAAAGFPRTCGCRRREMAAADGQQTVRAEQCQHQIDENCEQDQHQRDQGEEQATEILGSMQILWCSGEINDVFPVQILSL